MLNHYKGSPFRGQARMDLPLRRERLTRYVMLALFAIMTLGVVPASPAATPSDLELAFRWAPIHRQDTDDTDADADFITAVDFDGDWNAQNNWEHQDDNPANLKAKVYYSVVETSTHWYIVYAFYHPRDWCDWWRCEALDEHHENDMEGVLAIVQKNGTTFGRFQGMVTVAHSDFYSFTPAGSPLTKGQEDIDGSVIMQAGLDGLPHPVTFQEAKGHGAKAWNGGFSGGDGVVYFPSTTTAEVPSSGNDQQVLYQLVDIFENNGLWARRNNSETFASFGNFRGDNGADNAANAPWRWDDQDDGGQLLGGELAVDPAKLVDIYFNYFNGLGNFSKTYRRNTYKAIPGLPHLTLGTITGTSIEVRWNDATSFETVYEVWHRSSGASLWTAVTLPANTTSWTHTGLGHGAYDYRVRACDAEGCLNFSNLVTGRTHWKKLTIGALGKGRVTGAGIDCGLTGGDALTAGDAVTGGDCSEFYPTGTVVTLTADPYVAYPEEWEFNQWTGACGGAWTTCIVTMYADLTATAVFGELIGPYEPRDGEVE